MYQTGDYDENRVGANADECRHCGGHLIEVSNAFVWLRKCLSCENSRLIGWASCRVGVLVFGEDSYARPMM
jgi:hypothetical protein